MVQRYYFIVNPKAGFCLDISGIKLLCDRLRADGQDVHLARTKSLEHAGELAQQAIAGCPSARNLSDPRQSPLVIIVAGGDGTVRTVIDAIAGSNVPVCIIPFGTENLLACELGLDGSLESTAAALKNGTLRTMDLGQANQRRFMAVIGVGFHGQVIRRVHSQRTGHISQAHYIWPICRTFWEYRFAHLRIEADGQLVCDEPALVFVSNIARYAVQLGIAPDADCGDGLLDLCIYKCNSRLRLLSHAVATAMKRSHKSALTLRRKCKEISISSPVDNVAVQIDGDPGPSLPLNIKVIPAAAQILTPPPPANHKYCPPVKLYHLKHWLLK